MSNAQAVELGKIKPMKYLSHFSAAIAFGLLSACASLMPPKSIIPATGVDIPADWLLELPSDNANALRWSELYNDPILLSYLRRAAEENYDIRTAQNRVTGAEAEFCSVVRY